jgi:hypothetical protein
MLKFLVIHYQERRRCRPVWRRQPKNKNIGMKDKSRRVKDGLDKSR